MGKNKKHKEKVARLVRTECTGCGTCCTDTMVPVNDEDARRLMKATGKAADEILRLFNPEETQFEPDREGWIKFTYGRRILGLKKKDSHCIFLDDDKRCLAYTARPVTCRTFPLHIKYNKQGRLTDINYIPDVKCARTLGNPDSLEKLLAVAIREDVEDDRFYKKLEQWNRGSRQGGKKAFLKFMGLDGKK